MIRRPSEDTKAASRRWVAALVAAYDALTPYEKGLAVDQLTRRMDEQLRGNAAVRLVLAERFMNSVP